MVIVSSKSLHAPPIPSLATSLTSAIAENDPVVTSLVFSLFAFARGIGNILSGPVSNALLKSNTLANAKFGYGVTNHGSLLVYTGLTMVLGSFCGISFRNCTSFSRFV